MHRGADLTAPAFGQFADLAHGTHVDAQTMRRAVPFAPAGEEFGTPAQLGIPHGPGAAPGTVALAQQATQNAGQATMAELMAADPHISHPPLPRQPRPPPATPTHGT